MFDTKSSFILSKLGIQRFESRMKKTNSEVFSGVLWGDILTLLNKPFNEFEQNESELLTKVVKSIFENGNNHPENIEINDLSKLPKKLRLLILFTDSAPKIAKDFPYIIESKPLNILKDSLEDKKVLWSKIKEFKDGPSAS